MKSPKLYGSAPVDEIALAKFADPYVKALHGELPSSSYLCEITQRDGTDLATMVFYRAILASPHGAFVRYIDSQPAEASSVRHKIKVLIVPAMFYQEHPEVGGDGSLTSQIARACGLDAAVVPIESRGSVSANARIIRDVVYAEKAKEIWLVSSSKGSAEVRLALQTYGNDMLDGRIHLWISVSGLSNGSSLIDHMLRSPGHRLKTHLLCGVTGVDYQGLRELTTGHEFWQTRFEPPAGMRVLNIVGVPLLCHVQKALLARYTRLKHLGPNDGMTVLNDSLLPGDIYPVWGADHFLRSSQCSPLLYRVFRAGLASQVDRLCADAAAVSIR